MFTAYFPGTLREAFTAVERAEGEGGRKKDVGGLLDLVPDYREMRLSVKTLRDLSGLFKRHVFPIALAYGREEYLSALAVFRSLQEAFLFKKGFMRKDLGDYLGSSDLYSEDEGERLGGVESEGMGMITVTSVHKAKGREFDTVIYVPSQKRDQTNFADLVAESILLTKGKDVKKELEEEDLRIDFVAFTRARKSLYVITDKPALYRVDGKIEDGGAVADVVAEDNEGLGDFSALRAYPLFVAGRYEDAKKALNDDGEWFVPYLERAFARIERLSFSLLTLTDRPDWFLERKLLNIQEYSDAAARGSEVHSLAQDMLMKELKDVPQDREKYAENIGEVISEVGKEYPKVFSVEEMFSISTKELFSVQEDILFVGKIDAVLEDGSGNYLLLDWKTDANNKGGAKHRQQLAVYREAFARAQGIDVSMIKVAIAYVGLRKRVNDGTLGWEIDERQPSKGALKTVEKRVNRLMEWKKDVGVFLEALKGSGGVSLLITTSTTERK